MKAETPKAPIIATETVLNTEVHLFPDADKWKQLRNVIGEAEKSLPLYSDKNAVDPEFHNIKETVKA